MYLLLILQFMFLVFIIAASASHQLPANQKSIHYYCLENTHIASGTKTVLKEGYIIGHNLMHDHPTIDLTHVTISVCTV